MREQCPTCEGRREFCVGYYSDGSEAWINCPTCEGKGAVVEGNTELWRAGRTRAAKAENVSMMGCRHE